MNSLLTHARLSTEQQFLLRIIGRTAPEDQEKEFGELAGQVDWRKFMEVASVDLHPYLDYCFKTRLTGVKPPASVMQVLSRARQVNAIMHLRRQKELFLILAKLESKKIPVIALKGAALCQFEYEDPTLRPMADLDLLVTREMESAARSALLEIGYQYPPRVAFVEIHLRPLQQPGSSILVELKSSLPSCEPYELSLDQVWARSVPVVLGGFPVRVMHHEDFLIHYGLHFSSFDRFASGPLRLLDTLLHVEHYEKDWNWPDLAARCFKEGYADWMFLTLKLTRDLLRAPIPDVFFDALTPPPRLRELEDLALEQIWSKDHSGRFAGRLSALICALNAPSRIEGAKRFVNSVLLWARKDMKAPLTFRNINPEGGRRLLDHLKLRVPSYYRAWARGELTKHKLNSARRVLKGKEQITEIMTYGKENKMKK
ncbi:MAG TPA: nucleotidyltransferase family protein [Terriglobia bacterium]|nr:nucleotidyltransferase family protein [Terriglobia bacterium]